MRTDKKIFSLIFWFVLMSTIAVVSSQQCFDNGYFALNGTYDAIRHEILSSLASNVKKDNKGFYSGSMVKGLDKVYAMAMCIYGSEPKACSDCLDVASRQLINICRNQTEAYTWAPHLTLCFARYSNRSFPETPEMHPRYAEYSNGGFMSSPEEIVEKWDKSVPQLIKDALDRNTSLSNRKYYSSGEIDLSKSQTVYAYMQCTPELSRNGCENCLQRCADDYKEDPHIHGRQGGIIAYPSCLFRWDLYPFSGAFNPTCKKITWEIIVAFVVPTGVVISVLCAAVAVLVCRRRKFHILDDSPPTNSLQYDLKTIEAATSTFSKKNMLGRGGFGEVFKGVLQDGSEIAVKRLSRESVQGVQEFKNETSLVAKLQHRNLVSVLGYCMEGEEKILVYEFVPNKSLDHFLFEPTKQGQLDWAKRYKIIVETAKGILYLHHDSPLKIIHRDLKASNILLDAEMKPKVADFGMARILGMDQSRADTKRVVGTYGYISPEYMMHGQFSMKSDVYSFGILVLEIISGKRNSNFHEIDDSGKNLVTHAWRHWMNGTPLDLVDAEIGGNYQSSEVIRCIHIALLCVQTDPEERPTSLTIVGMLNSDSISLPVPQSPVYERLEMGLPPITSVPVSTNDSLISGLVPR